LRAVTAAPLWLTVAPHASVTCWPLPKVNVAVQADVAAEVALRTLTSPWNPPVHWPVIRYVAVHAPLDGGGVGGLGGVVDGPGSGLWNCVKNVHVSCGSQATLEPASRGVGV
jgi:hypothetical protein